MPLYSPGDTLLHAPDLTDSESWVWRECANQIYRLKRQWGYGRWTDLESRQVAHQAADRAVQIMREHPPLDATPEIPAILHRVVGVNVPEEQERWWHELVAMHPDWLAITWQDPLDPKDFPRFGHLWPKARSGAQLADMIRVEVLDHFGGIYLDADMRPLAPLDDLLPTGAFAAWEDETTVPNAAMGFSPGHPALRHLMDQMAERLPGAIWWAGPGATTLLAGRDDITLFEPEAFYPVHYRAKATPEQFGAITRETHPNTFAVHTYAGSWLKKG